MQHLCLHTRVSSVRGPSTPNPRREPLPARGVSEGCPRVGEALCWGAELLPGVVVGGRHTRHPAAPGEPAEPRCRCAAAQLGAQKGRSGGGGGGPREGSRAAGMARLRPPVAGSRDGAGERCYGERLLQTNAGSRPGVLSRSLGDTRGHPAGTDGENGTGGKREGGRQGGQSWGTGEINSGSNPAWPER